MKTNRIVIAGGTGFIGTALATALSRKGDDVVILTRDPKRWTGPGRAVAWDGKSPGAWTREVDGSHAVINLAGKNVNCRYTKKALHEIDQSRVDAVTVMNQAIASCANPPKVLIQAATTAIYGDAGEKWCDETTPPGEGVPPQTAMQWEDAFVNNPTPRTRRVSLRMSFVLGSHGGAFRMLSMLTKCFMGGAVGSGRQYISWIHIDDVVRIVLQAIDDNRFEGIYNVATPNPVTNDQFMRELRRALGRPWSPPVPAIVVKLGCFILRTEPVLALTGRKAKAQKLIDAGFEFRYAFLGGALADLVAPRAASPRFAAQKHGLVARDTSG